ncbi:hypothetical protein GCM10009867_08060 [Pedococcus aerophilus]|uniref:HNH nuclease domain-containing protein n=1 Tax=Pedococcus aerophilus TaxID=436356 RepID=A0ABN3UGF2_9MICO
MATTPDSPHPTSGGRVGGARLGSRSVLGSAQAALRELTEELSRPDAAGLWELQDGEVAQALGVLAEVVAAARAQVAAVLAEAKGRSLGAGQGWGPVDWARAVAPALTARELLDANVVATAVASLGGAAGPGVGGDARLEGLVDAVLGAASPDPQERVNALGLGKAAQLCRFHTSIRGLAAPDDLAEAFAALVEVARGDDGIDERRLGFALQRAGEVIRPDAAVERDADRRRAHRSLVNGRGPVGMSRYTLVLDEEGAAIVDAAVDALAKPRRDEDTGEHDPRTPAARRADALLDLVGRAVSAPDGIPRQAKTSLVVTVPWEVLKGQCRGAGLTLDEQALTPGVVRRLACDAQVVPAVLGSAGEVLDQGTAVRLFDRAQIRHLWLRDGGCTFPGCSKPAAWTDAHHLVHWVDGGPSDIDNAALLCRAHHTVVHQQRYAGRVVRDGGGGHPGVGERQGRPRVVWDLAVGSYDTALRDWRERTRPRSVPAAA